MNRESFSEALGQLASQRRAVEDLLADLQSREQAAAQREREIRDLYFRIFLVLRLVEPMLFGDYIIESFPDGTFGARTDWRKI